MSASKQTIAFFGATGGCAGTALAAALRDGYTCTALVRTPEKLRNILTNEHGISSVTLENLLTIHSGNVRDTSAVQKALVSPANPSILVDTIVFGVGAAAKMKASLTQPFTIDDPNVCEFGTRTVLESLSSLAKSGVSVTKDDRKPLYITVSTTGISDKKRDVPAALYPLYHWTLKVPHEDKKKMEHMIMTDNGANIRDFVIVRPTLLASEPVRGPTKVRAGWEWGVEARVEGEKEPGPQMGYQIGRTDVGEWIFREAIAKGGWEGKAVSLTY
ncbi:hypothetical protein BCR34DRAFT_616207 [Clohesyomyces aquaticus]|uniref:NAD(P)-binding domain-containing protein n=1 Tax=Clohesyomyces aquaticus TaxID=1231657 RepID=A0A1Y1ZET5_9PLEO|nr:hypothetical protein BCR34DRAFT_616207 [Clohesyomyces aquaticus]